MSAWLLKFFTAKSRLFTADFEIFPNWWSCWCFWGVSYKSIVWACFFSDVGFKKLNSWKTCPGLIFQSKKRSKNDPKNQVTNKPAETKHEIGLKPVFRNETACRFILMASSPYKILLKFLELKVPQNLLKNCPYPREMGNTTTCHHYVFTVYLSSLEPTNTSWAFLATLFVQGIDWVLCLRDWHYPVPTQMSKKKSEKSEVAWFLRNLTTNKEILGWLLGYLAESCVKQTCNDVWYAGFLKPISLPLPVSCLQWLCCCVDRQVVSGTGTFSFFLATVGWGNRIQQSRDATEWSKSSGKEIYSKKRKKHLQQFAFTSSKFCK